MANSLVAKRKPLRGKTNNHLSIINNHLAMAALYICRVITTYVVRALQINSFMQNKANFRKVK
jgi:hypothetical protein